MTRKEKQMRFKITELIVKLDEKKTQEKKESDYHIPTDLDHVRDIVTDLFDTFGVDNGLFKNKYSSRVTLKQYKLYKSYIDTQRRGDLYPEVVGLLDKKEIIDGDNGAYQFPLSSQDFLIKWCCSQKDENIKLLKENNFENVDIDVLNSYVTNLCNMIDALDIHSEIKECQKQRIYHRTGVGWRTKRKEIAELVEVMQHNMLLPIKEKDSQSDQKFSPQLDCLYNNSNCLTNVDLQLFFDVIVQDYKSCIEKHNFIFKRMIEGRKQQLEKMVHTDLETTFSLNDLIWSIFQKEQYDAEIRFNDETMEQLVKNCEKQIKELKKRLASKQNEWNKLLLEIDTFNHSADGKEDVGRGLYGQLFLLEEEIERMETELDACKYKKMKMKTEWLDISDLVNEYITEEDCRDLVNKAQKEYEEKDERKLLDLKNPFIETREKK